MELTFKEFLRGGKEQLAAAGFAEVEAEHLLAHTLGLTRMDLHNPLTVENALAAIGDMSVVEETFWKLLDRRCAHEPLQYLTGVAYFRHLEIKVGPGVLVPRPESELLVESVLTHIDRMNKEKMMSAVSVVDLGAGSGALALAVATEAPNTHVIAVEKSAQAIYWLKENVSFIDEKVRIVESDVASALEGVKCDVVIANPPYIPDGQELPVDVREHEPALALAAGVDGLEAIRQIAAGAVAALGPGGLLLLEHHHDQSEAVHDLLAAAGLVALERHRDLEGVWRFASARSPQPPQP